MPAWFPPKQTPLVTQLIGLLGQFGQVVSAVGLVAMVNSSGWRSTYLLAAGGAAVAAALAFLLIRDAPPGVEPERTEANVKQLPHQVAEVISHPSTRLAFLGTHVVEFRRNRIFADVGYALPHPR
ncbi:hypothetical protein JCM18909_1315 [Cutibacterium acnes JCM 18909]|nr:hypothetical protein JCM18909_1315 [Cutibacterium acnes JCM 18909]